MPRCSEDRPPAPPHRPRAIEPVRAVAALLLSLSWPVWAAPALAQVSGAVTLASDQRWRGRSTSAGRPVASATLGYDARGGAYVDSAATTAWTRKNSIALIAAAVDAGYAWRTARFLTVDVGATRQQYTRYASGGRWSGYSEIYAGVSNRGLAARIAYSPDYFRPGSQAVYASVDGAASAPGGLRVSAHGGAIAYVSPLRVPGLRTIEYDGGAGVSRRIGALELGFDLTFGGPDPDFYRNRAHSKTALLARAAVVF